MLQIYNTLKRKKEEFHPRVAGQVSLYVCGVTVYDYCHLGHARSLIVFDMIYRYFLYKGYAVTFVRNFTDIDDKIIQRSNEKNISWQQLTAEFIQAFHEDTAALGLKLPTHEPKATNHIQEMIDFIYQLEKLGFAYVSGRDVFFSVRKFKNYGKLSGKNIDDLEAGARVDVMDSKQDPLDFVLWKGSKPDEPFWESPWGQGRPGWHIECSAMSLKYLQSGFDIHGGGRDLIFPHHENEIAQSEACTHQEFARYWVHNGFVNINKEKMSKSLNNFLTIRDLLKIYPAEAVRLFVLSSHYRSPLDYTEQNIQNAVLGLKRFYQTKKRLMDFLNQPHDFSILPEVEDKIIQFKNEVGEALEDDFNTAKIVGAVFELIRFWNKSLDEQVFTAKSQVYQFLDFINNDVAAVLGIFGGDAQEVLAQMNQMVLNVSEIAEEEILDLISKRQQAKKNKDYKLADEIRQALQAKGVKLKDSADGLTTWEMV